MDKEYESLKNNETLVLVSLPPERRDKSTFLHGKLEEDIYIEQSKGYTNDSFLVQAGGNHYMGSRNPPL